MQLAPDVSHEGHILVRMTQIDQPDMTGALAGVEMLGAGFG